MNKGLPAESSGCGRAGSAARLKQVVSIAFATMWRASVLVGLVVLAAESGAAAGETTAGASGERKSASSLVAAADKEFRADSVDAAVRLYSEALALEAAPRTYYARHKAYLKLKKLPAAISDLSDSLALDASFQMAYLQRASLYLLTGRCDDAVADYQSVLRLDSTKRDAHARLPHAQECAAAIERAAYARRAGDWHTVREALNAAMEPERATAAPGLMLQRAEANLRLGDLDNTVSDTGKVLKLESGNLAAYSLRAQALSMLGDYETARKHYQQCLHYDPEQRECKEGYRALKVVAKIKERGDAAIAANKWADAADAWQDGLAAGTAMPSWQREVRTKLARACLKKGDLDAAAHHARDAIAADDGNADAHHTLGEVLLQREAWDDAVREAHRAHELERGSAEYRDFAQRAEAALKQSKQKDYYRILGVPRNADDGAIKRAYRQGARQWHPDMAKPEERELFEAKFRDIAEAYDVLTDADKRQRYDRGEDVTGNPQQQQGPGQGHPFHPFGGGFPFGHGGGATFTFHRQG